MLRRYIYIPVLSVICICMLFLSACSREVYQEDNQGYTFTDSEGVTVSLNKNIQKSAILFSSYVDIWNCAGGKTDITVYESAERGFVDDGAVFVDSGGGHSTIDMETLIASNPDFVVGTADYDSQREAIEFCRSKGIPSALFRVESFDDYLEVLRIFCDITGNEEAYIRSGTEVKDKIDKLLKDIPQGDAPKVLLVRAGASAKYTKAKATDDHFVGKMLKDLGCINIADSEVKLTSELSLEEILEQNPDYMFITTMGDETEARTYMDSLLCADGWKELDCVKNGRCVYLPKDLFHYKPNSRWFEAYDYLSSIIYSGK